MSVGGPSCSLSLRSHLHRRQARAHDLTAKERILHMHAHHAWHAMAGRRMPCHAMCAIARCRVPEKGEYPALYLGRGARGAGGKKINEAKGILITAARLVCAFVNGLPEPGPPEADAAQRRGRSACEECVHLCDNKRCVNPLHLVWASMGVNMKGNRDGNYEGQLAKRGGDLYCRDVTVAQLPDRWRDAMMRSPQ